MTKLACALILFVALLLFGQVHRLFASPTRSQSPAKRHEPIFVFHTDEFWLNLHHFLYVLARAENKERDAAREAVSNAPADQERGLAHLNQKERGIWREAVAWYAAGLGKKDIVFDDPLPAITGALARAGAGKSLSVSKSDEAISSVLERTAPIYRKAWWQEHQKANRTWQKTVQALVDRHGAAVLAYITNAYGLHWPDAGFPVHISAYANWAGAYSTTGNLLVLSSQNPSVQGEYGLETIFHEGMHQWDDQVFDLLIAQAKRVKKVFPRGLDHALVFFTAGEAVRQAIPAHIPYAIKFGIWDRGLSSFKAPLEEIWKPYLEGHGTRDDALAELIKRTAVSPPPK